MLYLICPHSFNLETSATSISAFAGTPGKTVRRHWRRAQVGEGGPNSIFDMGSMQRGAPLLQVSLIQWERLFTTAAACVEAARSAGGQWIGGPGSSRGRKKTLPRVAIGREDGPGDFHPCCEGAFSIVLYYYYFSYYYTPFMSRIIVTEAVGTYSDGQGRG